RAASIPLRVTDRVVARLSSARFFGEISNEWSKEACGFFRFLAASEPRGAEASFTSGANAGRESVEGHEVAADWALSRRARAGRDGSGGGSRGLFLWRRGGGGGGDAKRRGDLGAGWGQ